jgi:hypothetical protein
MFISRLTFGDASILYFKSFILPRCRLIIRFVVHSGRSQVHLQPFCDTACNWVTVSQTKIRVRLRQRMMQNSCKSRFCYLRCIAARKKSGTLLLHMM